MTAENADKRAKANIIFKLNGSSGVAVLYLIKAQASTP
jgi:hypothetical protein